VAVEGITSISIPTASRVVDSGADPQSTSTRTAGGGGGSGGRGGVAGQKGWRHQCVPSRGKNIIVQGGAPGSARLSTIVV